MEQQIISFLGAIHWGLEYAGYGGNHSYRRYAYGVIAPAVAWPTIFMPVEYALITQFLAMIFQYFSDAKATVRGWCPPWYNTYRFVLTFFAGASIVLSLIGRGQIIKSDAKTKRPVGYADHDHDAQWKALEREEVKKRQAETAAEDEAGDENETEESQDEQKDGGKSGKQDSKEESKGSGESDEMKDSKEETKGGDDKKQKK
jgi:hypothetical protein